MSDFLAIDWEHRQICGVDADVTSSGVRVRQAFSWDWPEGKSPAEDAPGAGAWLNEQFQKLGLSTKEVLVTLPREDAIVRVIEVPNVPDGDLPNVVRFQAAAKSARSLDTLLLDFLPLPRREGITGREVLVATIGKETLEPLRLVLSRVGCELAGVSLSAPATVELIARLEQHAPASPDALELSIVLHEQRVEISLLRQLALLLTHSARLPDDASTPERIQQAVVAEVNRSLVALKRQHADLSLTRAWLWGDVPQSREMAAVLRKRFGCEVETTDPLNFPGLLLEGDPRVKAHALFAGPIGMLFSKSHPKVPTLDFLHPREPVVPRDLRKLWTTVGASAAAALLIGAFGWRMLEVHRLNADAEDYRSKAEQLKKELDAAAPMVRNTDIIARWADQRVVWLERLNELAIATQGTERRYLVNLNCQTGGSDVVGVMKGNGFAKEREDIEDLTARLSARQEVTVVPHEIRRVGTDGDYPFQFELDLSWKPVQQTGKNAGSRQQGVRETASVKKNGR
jgi:Tfp pilus assembly PilM family ATPase